MKEIYILFINLIISIIASLTRSYVSSKSDKSLDDVKSKINKDIINSDIHKNKNRNTLYKLLFLKKQLEIRKCSKNNE